MTPFTSQVFQVLGGAKCFSRPLLLVLGEHGLA